MALYRTYRPHQFDQVVGQDIVVKALQNALASDRLAHALLLSGPHGIGKTTLARLIAQSILCEKYPTSQPCGECNACKSCQEDSHPDLLEIDAASNRGVDDARSLRDRLQMSPMLGQSHVIIIDEAHMLTREAQNALLKALEEPPSHIHFIFATTAAAKVLPTIRSRCQHYQLRRPTGEQIEFALKRAADQEGIKINEEALSAISGIAAGSFRDALSLLDQIYSSGGNTDITAELVYQLSGLPGPDRWAELIKRVASGDAGGALTLLQELQSEGYDLRESLGDLAQFLRLLMYAQQTGAVPESLASNSRLIEHANALSGDISENQLWMLVGIIEKAYSQSSAGGSAVWTLENGIVAVANNLGQNSDFINISHKSDSTKPAQTSPQTQTTPVPSPPTSTPKEPAKEPVEEPAKEQLRHEDSKPTDTPRAKSKVKETSSDSEKAVKQNNKPSSEEIKLPGPAVAAAAFPLLRLAMREHHTEIYLALRTAWARYEEGRMVVQLVEVLDKQTHKEATELLRRMVDGSVKITSRPKTATAKKPKQPLNNTQAQSGKSSSDPADLLAQFGMTPLDGDKRDSTLAEEKGDFGLPSPDED